MSIANSEQASFQMFTELDLVTADHILIGKEFHARGPAIEKALSLKCSLV